MKKTLLLNIVLGVATLLFVWAMGRTFYKRMGFEKNQTARSETRVLLSSLQLGDSKTKVIGDSKTKVIGDSKTKVIGDSKTKVIGDSKTKVIGDSKTKVIGDSKTKVRSRVQTGGFKHLTLDRRPVTSWIVQTPLEFGAKNWILFVEFDTKNNLAAIRLRTSDGSHIRPRDIDFPDRVRPNWISPRPDSWGVPND